MSTLTVAAVGYAIAALAGIAIGVAIGLSESLRAALEPIINALYSTPMAMFIPVIGIYLGLRFAGQVFLVVTFCIFLVVINTAAGVRQVPAEHWELGRSFELGYASLLKKIVLPNASPYILAGLRISIARAVAGAIAAELLMSSTGLGLYLSRAGSNFDIDRLVAGTLFVALLGAGVAVAARIVEHKLLAWNSV